LLQYKDPMKYDLVYSALIEANREDLIGYGPKCLIKPRKKRNDQHFSNKSRELKETQGREKGKIIKSKPKDKSVENNFKKKSKAISTESKRTNGSRQENKTKSKNKRR